MNHLKKFNEALNHDKIVDELKTLSHILEDEGFNINIELLQEGILDGILISISTNKAGSARDFYGFDANNRHMDLLMDSEYYEEYIDRVKEIADRHKYVVPQIKQNYIYIRPK